MAKKMDKFLSYDAIKKMDEKKFREKKTIEVEGYIVQIDKHFRNSKMYDLVSHMMEKIIELNGLGRDIFQEVDFNLYIAVMIIKFFTSVEIPDDYEYQIAMLKLLIDNDMVSPIMDGFEEEELDKLMTIIKAISENTFSNALEANKHLLELTGADGQVD